MASVPAGTTVIVVQSNSGAVNCPEAAKIMQEGLCGCCEDLETCLCATFCWSCAFGTWIERAGMGQCCGPCCVYSCMMYFGMWCCLACYAGNYRTMLFLRLGLPDPGCCANWCIHLWCRCCAIAQEGRAAKAMMAAGVGKPMAPAAGR
jgi:Cys-rich protein (TIGR01571 family)